MIRLFYWLKDLWRGNALGGLRHKEWDRVREVYKFHNPYCKICGTNKKIEIHHILPFFIRPDLELVDSNFISLCRNHHFLFGHLLNWKSFNLYVKNDSELWSEKIKNRQTKGRI